MRFALLLSPLLILAACNSQQTTGLGDTGTIEQADSSTNMDLGVGRDSGSVDLSGPWDLGSQDSGMMGRVPKNHRPQALSCDRIRPRPQVNSFPGSSCQSHDDCTMGENGRCSSVGRGGVDCTYDQCFSDSDCGRDQVCACEGGLWSDHNVCLGGNCKVNADCGPGGYCSPSYDQCGSSFGFRAYYCHTPQDECIDDEDCGATPNNYCAFDELEKRWMCKSDHCVG